MNPNFVWSRFYIHESCIHMLVFTCKSLHGAILSCIISKLMSFCQKCCIDDDTPSQCLRFIDNEEIEGDQGRLDRLFGTSMMAHWLLQVWPLDLL
jgi:hypothetical protein